jgi:hypothetical protein
MIKHARRLWSERPLEIDEQSLSVCSGKTGANMKAITTTH